MPELDLGNVMGPQGLPGAPGAAGQDGRQGDQGEPGRDASINGVNALQVAVGQGLKASMSGTTYSVAMSDAEYAAVQRAASGGEIDASLSKKVAKPIQIPSSADLNDYTAPGFYYVGADAAAVTIKNSPVSHSFALLVEIGANGDPVQTLKTWIDVDQYRATTFVRSKYPNWHGGWIKNATTTPPRAFTLPLAAGWTRHRSCQYFKTQDNVVTVYFQVKADVPKSGETIIATLPVGFRPDDLIGGTGYCVMPDSIYFPADIKVFQDGNITGFNTQGEAQYYTGFFTFVAGA